MEEKKSDETKDLWVIRKMEITAIKFMKPEVRKVMTIMLLRECLFLLFIAMSFYRCRWNVIISLKTNSLLEKLLNLFGLLKKFKKLYFLEGGVEKLFNLFLTTTLFPLILENFSFCDVDAQILMSSCFTKVTLASANFEIE